MEGSLLRDLFLMGERLASALVDGDLDSYFDLLDERGTLLDGLNAYQHPSDIDPDWQEISEALQEQHHVLTIAVAEREREMQEALAELERFKGAARTYQRSEPRAQILNSDLRV